MERDYSDLAGCQTLIVEDDNVLALETADAVQRDGGFVLGPVPDMAAALAIVAAQRVDAVVVDLNLGDEDLLPVTKALRETGARIVFVAGYDDWYLPNDLDNDPLYWKRTDTHNVIQVLF